MIFKLYFVSVNKFEFRLLPEVMQ